MSNEYIIGLIVSILVGVLSYAYKILREDSRDNKNNLAKLAEKVDGRLDEVEKDITKIKSEIKI